MIRYTTQRKIDCLKRELSMRRSVYPKRVLQGRLDAKTADEEIAVLEAILEDYVQRTRNQQQSLPL